MKNINFQKPFALIKRKSDAEVCGFQGKMGFYDRLEDLAPSKNKSEEEPFQTLCAIPFAQIKERGFPSHDDGTKISALHIETSRRSPLDAVLKFLPQEPIELADEIRYDQSDEEYADIIKNIIEQEIGNGEGANFVIERRGRTQIEDMSVEKALSIFRNLLENEIGSHWTFLFYDGTRYLVGASPETHIAVQNGRVKMHPISGTFRKKGLTDDIRKCRKAFLKFLQNPKEINELFMVVDEELKMMAELCSSGGMIIGPILKEMSHLIHTEYLLSGKSEKHIIDILRTSLFAATVVGSPLENACRILQKYEPQARRFYGSCVALLGTDEAGRDLLDGAITIRTAEISPAGVVQFGVGTTLVRDSDPEDEVQETEAKAEALIRGLTGQNPEPPKRIMSHFEEDDEVLETLQMRNQKLSTFWFFNQEEENNILPVLENKKVLLINNVDDFCYMMKHMFSAFGARPEVIRWEDYDFERNQADLTVIGPGTGNPNDESAPKMQKIMSFTKSLLASERNFMGVCLGHQFLCRALGLEVSKKAFAFQGVQEKIDYFGTKERVGFYNTFSGKYDPTSPPEGEIEVAFNAKNQEIYALRGSHFSSVQFHPESILTQNGLRILKTEMERLFSEI